MHDFLPILAQTAEEPDAQYWVDSIIFLMQEFSRAEAFIFPAYWGILVARRILRSV